MQWRCFKKRVYKIVRGDETWTYVHEPENKQQSTQDESLPKKVFYTRSTSKQMVACFSGKTGHVTAMPLKKNYKMINYEWNTKPCCFPEVFEEIGITNIHCHESSFVMALRTSKHLFKRSKNRIIRSSDQQSSLTFIHFSL